MIRVIGDCHGNPEALWSMTDFLPDDTVISVGDWGYTDDVTSLLPFTVHVNKGNKEQWRKIDLTGRGFYRRPGEVITVEGVKIGFIPGAASPNGIITSPLRRRNEMPEIAVWNDTPDVVISHDAPSGSPLEQFDRPVFPTDKKRIEKSRLTVASMIRSSGATRVIHGHYHRGMDYTWEGKNITSLSAFEKTGKYVTLT